ncbi:MAG: STAS domain-containing protein [Myxococcus sp.]|nr:STAS domain-containing protein [Myxococcus sp.]
MRYGHHDELSWLSFEEPIRYTECRELKAFLDQVVIPEMADTMVIDLRDVPSIDSTGLGLLASIGRHSLDHLSRRAVILCPEGQVSQTLKAMQFDKLFNFTSTLEKPAELRLAPVEVCAKAEPLATVMLEAHKELSEVDERNKQRFSDVVEVLEQAVTRGNTGSS